MMKLLTGLSEGQVLQRVGIRGASVRLAGTLPTPSENGVLYATILRAGTPLVGWTKRRVGQSVRLRFTAELHGIPAGGPYRLVLARGGVSRTVVRSFYVGDVWLLAGQSNMEGCGLRSLGTAKPHRLIRAFSLAREWRQAADPLHVPWESPDPALNEGKPFTRAQAEDYRRTSVRGVGPGVLFAREMLARSGVPQGLVCCARGATRMDQWDPALKDHAGGSLYGAMLASMRATGQPCAGVLWQQGESDNAPEFAAAYGKRIQTLITSARRDLRQPGLPWIIGQLGRLVADRPESRWNLVQEEQRRLAGKIKNLELIATIDLPLDDFIHLGATAMPRLAERYARAADRLVYVNKNESPAPALRRISSLTPDSATGAAWIDVTFDHIVGGLRAEGRPHGFALLDADGRELPLIHHISLRGDTARLHVVPEALASSKLSLSYGHGLNPYCNLTDARDFAVPVFGPLPVAAD